MWTKPSTGAMALLISGRMDIELQALSERVTRLLETSRRLADENRTLKGRLGEAMAARDALEQRVSEARARVESALARLPIRQDPEEEPA
jgi:uncharacterized protein (TIGR02449 family)